MNNTLRNVLPAGLILILGACASAPTEKPDDTALWRGPCQGLGERFHTGTTDVTSALTVMEREFPSNATITRTAKHHGIKGVCYTTPQTRAEDSADQ